VRRDREYFETRVRPFLHEPGIHFIGEVGDAEKATVGAPSFCPGVVGRPAVG
jgi:hypothetical protein